MRSDQDSPVDLQFSRIARRASGRSVRRGHAAGYTTQQQNAHITEQREVLYRWHPWHGRTVAIVGAMVRGGIAIFRCRIDDSSRALEVPQWMFDVAVCYRTQLAPQAIVACQALYDLRDLIQVTDRISSTPVLQAEHLIPTPRAVLMQRSSRRTSSGQLRLFPPTAPLRWTSVPLEARERVLALLARLLCQHARARRASEVRDE